MPASNQPAQKGIRLDQVPGYDPATAQGIRLDQIPGYDPAKVQGIRLDQVPGYFPPSAGKVPESRRVYPVDSREPAQDIGVGQRILQRLTGSDVQDPLALERMGGVALGATGGAMLGSKVPLMNPLVNPLTGAAAGGVLGATTGAVAPEAVRSTARKFGLLPKDSEAGLPWEDLREVAKGEALLEMATGGVLQGARLAGRAAATAITKPGAEGRDLARRATAEGIEITPFQAGKRGKGIINVLGRFPLIGSAARRFGGESEKQLATMLSEAPGRVGPLLGETELGMRIYDESRGLFKAFNEDIGARYKEVFADAEKAGVRIKPDNAIAQGEETLASIAEGTTKDAKGNLLSSGKTLDKVRDFIQSEISPMLGAEGGAPQSLAQMDGLLSKVDQEIASFPIDERKAAIRALEPLKTAIKADVATNAVGDGAEEISKRLAALDGEFTTTMSFLFETSVAKRFQSVRRQGLKGAVRASDEATRTPVDQLAKLVINTKSPQAIDELFRLVGKDTRSMVAAHITDKAVNSAISVSEGVQRVNAAMLKRNFGLDNRKGPLFAVMERVMRESGVTMKQMETFVDAAAAMEKNPIPNASTFVARSAVMGGRHALASTLTGGMLVAGAGGVAGGASGALVGALMFLGGGRLLTSIISNPINAKPFFKALDKEASVQVRRQAYMRAARLGLIAMSQDQGESPTTAVEKAESSMKFIRSIVDGAITGQDRALKE